MVSVTGTFFEEGSGVAHSPQNFCVSGLSVSHLGHLMAIIPSYSDCPKNINE
jgi:hypothetical protein